MSLCTNPLVLTITLTIDVWMDFETKVFVFTEASVKMFTFITAHFLSGQTSEREIVSYRCLQGLHPISLD